MSLRIEKYNAGRLKEFIGSPAYEKMPVVPVTTHRALSWLNNPRMDPEDCLLYTAHEGEHMVAYRAVLPDRFGDTCFGWLSGNWVAFSLVGIIPALFFFLERKKCRIYPI